MTHPREVFRLLLGLAGRNRHFHLVIDLILTWQKSNRDESSSGGFPSSPLSTKTSQTNERSYLRGRSFIRQETLFLPRNKEFVLTFQNEYLPSCLSLILIPQITMAEL